MRTTKSLKNMIFAALSNVISIIISFVIQTIFIKTLGTEYLGIDKLFINIISMLSIVDLGLGSAIIYNMYKPVDSGDKEKIKALMNFYKKAYNIIIVLVSVIGLSLIPFLGLIVKDVSISENIIIIYILFLLDMVASYILAYKKSIFYADQKNYFVVISRICYLTVMNTLLVIVLLTVKNYYLYLIIRIVIRLLENIVMSNIADKKYPYLKDKEKEELDKVTKKDIYTKIKGLLFHKIGSFIVLGTDNIIISSFLGVVQVGYYSNYKMIIYSVLETINQGFSAVTSSIGNLLIGKNKNKNFEVYKKIDFLNFWVSIFCSISIFIIIETFVKIWLGEEFLLSRLVLITLTINFYLSSIRAPMNSFKEAAGIYHEDRFIPLFESLINIVSSIILLKFFGLAGVFMGTIMSSFILHFYSYPKYVYKRLFNRSYKSYFIHFFKKFIVMIIIWLITYYISRIFIVDNNLLQLLINMIICLVIPNLLFIIIYKDEEEYKYFKNLAKKGLRYLKRDKKISN